MFVMTAQGKIKKKLTFEREKICNIEISKVWMEQKRELSDLPL